MGVISVPLCASCELALPAEARPWIGSAQLIGQTLSHFKITAKLGEGGMGVVYRAEDTLLGREVAIKVLPEEALASQERRRRFLREARAASALSHASIVTIFEVGSEGGTDFIAMELVRGEPLHRAIPKDGLGEGEALAFAVQIADALTVAHSEGIVHRDLKPANIIVTPAGQVKILDFGLAKRLRVASDTGDLDATTLAEPTDITAAGAILGTPRYMSPEQARGLPADARSDIFSFGCVLYEMLAGVSPFSGGSALEAASSVLRDEPTSLAERRGDLSEELVRLVERMLEKDPERRIASTSTVKEAIEALREDIISARSSGALSAVLADVRRTRWRPAILVAALLIAGSAAVYYWTRSSPSLRLATPELLSTFPGEHRQAAFSPAGDAIAFVGPDARGVDQVWTKGFHDGDAVQLTDGPPASRPRWTPDAMRLVFARRGEGIWSIRARGGEPEQLLAEGTNPDLSADGGMVFERGGGIWLASANGTDQRRLVEIEPSFFANVLPRDPTFSPDGRFVSYFMPHEDFPSGDIWLVEVQGGAPRVLAPANDVERAWPAWTPDGRFVIFVSARQGARNLWAVPVEGGEAIALTTGAGEDTEPAVSRDGRRLVYTNTQKTYALARLEPGSAEPRILLEQRRPLALPAVSPQGDRIAFFSGSLGASTNLVTIRGDGTGLVEVTRDEGNNLAPTWSADGAHLYFYRQLPNSIFARVPVEGGPVEEILSSWKWVRENSSAVDPAGERLAYTRWHQGMPIESRVRDLTTGREHPLGATLYQMLWTPDGLAILGGKDGEILRCPAGGGACQAITRGALPRWGPQGRLYVSRPGWEAWSLEPDGSDERREGHLTDARVLTFGWGVLADGSMVWSQVRHGRNELWTAAIQ